MFRKTVLATAIIGAGLGSMSGAAFAGDAPSDSGSSHSSDDSHGHSHGKHHESWGHDQSSSCSNDVTQANETTGGGAIADVLGGAQTAAPINACHILSDNHLLNNIDVSLLSSR